MTKKHFEMIARVLRETPYVRVNTQSDRAALARAFADVLHWENDRFDRERFLAACEPQGGVEPKSVEPEVRRNAIPSQEACMCARCVAARG